MALKKINIELYYNTNIELMNALYDVHRISQNGFRAGTTKNATFEILYAEEIPYRIDVIDGKKYQIYQSSMNSEKKSKQ